MKRTLVAAILGLSLSAVQDARAAGHIYFTNASPLGGGLGGYWAVVWSPSTPGDGRGVRSTDGVQMSLWYGEGAGLSQNQLSSHVVLPWSTLQYEAYGFYGYFDSPELILPNWEPGDTYTFQLRTSGTSIYGPVDEALSRGNPWSEGNIQEVGIPITYTFIPYNSSLVVYVPEPSTGLLGLGLMTMIFAKRRSGLTKNPPVAAGS